MAKCQVFNLDNSTPVLVFSGTGFVRFLDVGSGQSFIGGSDVDSGAKGIAAASLGFRVDSADEIYAIGSQASGVQLKVFSTR